MGLGTWKSIGIALGLCLAASACAQTVQQQPVRDSSVEASPLTPPPKQPVVDGSVQASPLEGVAAQPRAGRSIAPHAAIPIVLDEAVDSGHTKNEASLRAKLRSAVQTSAGPLPAGTPVTLTVVETVPAGKISAAGEFSLQVQQVGPIAVFTDTQTFRGKPGHQDLPDSAPAIGTDAALARGATLTFHVQPPPTAAAGPPKKTTKGPGSINGVVSGQTPPAK